MSTNYNTAEREFTRIYENMRGVDFSEIPRENSNKRFGYLENMYVDYACGGSLVESIPGFRILKSIGKKIHSIFSHKVGDGSEYILIHAGTYLYRFRSDMRDSLASNWQVIANNLNNGKSSAIAFGDYIFIFDGEKIIFVTNNGSASIIGEHIPAYVPSLTLDGKGDENVNLLTNRARGSCFVSSFSEMSRASQGLTYVIMGEDEKYCEVTGIADNFSGALYIPSYTTIDGVKYKVKSIGRSAFRDNKLITELYTNDNLEVIDKYSFWGCSSLKTVSLSETVSTIAHHAFYNCTSLEIIYVGTGFEKYEVNCFAGCESLSKVYYAGDEASTADIVGKDRLGDAAIVYNSPLKKYVMAIPISSKIERINSVTINNSSINFGFDTQTSEIIITLSSKSKVSNSMIHFEGTIKSSSDSGAIFSQLAAAGVSPADAIRKCTVCAIYDGRIFISGNPLLPGYVFYASIDKGGDVNPLYYSANDFFVDGVGKYDITSLLAAQDNLVVFKSGDDGSGSVFYHTADIVDGVKKYPVAYVHKGLDVKGESYCFYDDTVFLSDNGLSALERSSVNGTKRVCCRSSNVNPRLFLEDIKDLHMTEWCGYLVISSGGRMYLADSRDKFSNGDSYEYEWYYLNGIGTYANGSRVFRYRSIARPGYKVHPDVGKITTSTVQSYVASESDFAFYVVEGGVKYEVEATDEYIGGSFSPATAVLGLGSLLYFGTESGDLCVFNNDKRGVAPDHIKNAEDFDEDEYNKAFGNRIHPDFYDFASRSPRYVAATVFDDCDLPDRRKNTVRSSLAVKFKAYPRSCISAEVSTDYMGNKKIGEFSASSLNFSDTDFGTLCLSARGYSTIPLMEYEKNWVEKRIALYSNEFRSPIGIYSIIYRYKVKGKLKTY